jgi:hypothetical protein
MTTGFAFSFGSIWNGLLPASPSRDHVLSEDGLNYCIRNDLKVYLPLAKFYRGLALARNGMPAEGFGLMREGMDGAEHIKMKMAWSIHLGHFGVVQDLLGDPVGALETLAQALLMADETGEQTFVAELHRTKAALLLKQFRDGEAEESLNQALVTARAQTARIP